jgi:hypothetical protein
LKDPLIVNSLSLKKPERTRSPGAGLIAGAPTLAAGGENTAGPCGDHREDVDGMGQEGLAEADSLHLEGAPRKTLIAPGQRVRNVAPSAVGCHTIRVDGSVPLSPESSTLVFALRQVFPCPLPMIGVDEDTGDDQEGCLQQQA